MPEGFIVFRDKRKSVSRREGCSSKATHRHEAGKLQEFIIWNSKKEREKRVANSYSAQNDVLFVCIPTSREEVRRRQGKENAVFCFV